MVSPKRVYARKKPLQPPVGGARVADFKRRSELFADRYNASPYEFELGRDRADCGIDDYTDPASHWNV